MRATTETRRFYATDASAEALGRKVDEFVKGVEDPWHIYGVSIDVDIIHLHNNGGGVARSQVCYSAEATTVRSL